MAINVKELTTYDISEDGSTATLSLVDDAGNPTSLRFQITDLGNLAMTLPSMIEAAMRRRNRDGSYRFAHPIGSWSIEQASDPSALIVTMRTMDGFGVSFCMGRGNAMQFADSLAEVEAAPEAKFTH